MTPEHQTASAPPDGAVVQDAAVVVLRDGRILEMRSTGPPAFARLTEPEAQVVMGVAAIRVGLLLAIVLAAVFPVLGVVVPWAVVALAAMPFVFGCVLLGRGRESAQVIAAARGAALASVDDATHSNGPTAGGVG